MPTLLSANGHGTGAARDADTVDAVDAEFARRSAGLRRVERRSVLTAPVLALRERMGGAGTIDRTAHGRHELQRGLDTAGPARPTPGGAMSPAARLGAAAIVVLTLVLAAVGSVVELPTLRASGRRGLLFALLGVAPSCSSRRCPSHGSPFLAVTGSLVGTIRHRLHHGDLPHMGADGPFRRCRRAHRGGARRLGTA